MKPNPQHTYEIENLLNFAKKITKNLFSIMQPTSIIHATNTKEPKRKPIEMIITKLHVTKRTLHVIINILNLFNCTCDYKILLF